MNRLGVAVPPGVSLVPAVALALAACGGGSSSGAPETGAGGAGGAGESFDDGAPTGGATGSGEPATETPGASSGPEAPPADAESATYEVRLESLWLVEDYPQDFPDGESGSAHLSHVGGATHNVAVSFWEPGEPASRGLEDVAETGRIELFLAEEVVPAIEAGTADSSVALREYTFSSPYTLGIGLPTEARFEIEVRRDWPLLTLVTMLGPSPDWFVGTDGLALREAGAWRDEVSVELPLYDGGTKSGMSPVMGGPDLVPPEPVRLIAYDPVTGTYGPSETPQTLARLTLRRTR